MKTIPLIRNCLGVIASLPAEGGRAKQSVLQARVSVAAQVPALFPNSPTPSSPNAFVGDPFLSRGKQIASVASLPRHDSLFGGIRIAARILFFLIPSFFLIQAGLRAEDVPSMEAESLASPISEKKSRVLILSPHAEGDPENIFRALKKYPQLRLTLLFPAHYFESDDHRGSLEQFRVLLASGIIEVGLTLDNEPILPLLGDLSLAGSDVVNWGFQFSWPEDVAGQIALGSGKYQKTWGQLPSGFFPPYGALSPEAAKAAHGFRLHWVLASPREQWGVRFQGAMGLLVSPKAITDLVEDPECEPPFHSLVAKAEEVPLVYVDSNKWPDPHWEYDFLNAIGRASFSSSTISWVTAREWTENLRDEYQLSSDPDLFRQDYAGWVQTGPQRLAWQALAEAREVVRNYQNSGRANLKNLDSALGEIYNAEGGRFLWDLGQSSGTLTASERNFLATLANVYRLCGVPVPANLNQWFQNRKWKIFKSVKTPSDRPFFIEGKADFAYQDPLGDDFGGGDYTYPSGKYSVGAFDISTFTFRWSDSSVKFSMGFNGIVPAKSNVIVPLADIYIDVNRIAEAGNTVLLRQRGAATIDRQAAWEYAVSFSPFSGGLYQAIPGSQPRRVVSLKPSMNGDNNEIEVELPRAALRGDPRQWRLTVVLMGTEDRRVGTDLVPAGISPQASQRSFGGAQTGRPAPPFVDILAESVDQQKTVLQNYLTGNRVLLPFVEGK